VHHRERINGARGLSKGLSVADHRRCDEDHARKTRLRVTKILLIRHGHVDGIEPARFRGRADLALTARGQAEAEAVAARIARAWRPAAIYTSPMGRCIATGEAVSKACGIAARICGDLNDIDYGSWQSRTYDEMKSIDSDLFAAWFATPQLVRFPNGESLQDLMARAADALRFVLGRHGGDTVVLVGHDSVNRALLLQLLDQAASSFWRLDQAPCCLNEIDVAGGCARVLSINDTCHLRPGVG
jgi:phosphoserine phosphatase